MLEVTETEIKNRLAFDNPWWSEGAVDKRFRDWPRRAYFDGFYRYVSERRPHRAVVLMGPRRVGKTVMLIQAIQALIESGVAPKTIAYVSVDTPTSSSTRFSITPTGSGTSNPWSIPIPRFASWCRGRRRPPSS